MTPLHEHLLIQKLLSLELPQEEYAIFGSGPLLAHGIRDVVTDLDVIATGSAWRRTITLGPIEPAPLGGSTVRFFDGAIEVFNDWVPPGVWDIQTLIEKAESIEGIRFAKLEYVLREKKRLARPKDLHDIELIEDYFKGKH